MTGFVEYQRNPISHEAILYPKVKSENQESLQRGKQVRRTITQRVHWYYVVFAITRQT